MGTGAESPGLSCPLDVDLFPAYSDDSPLCDCSFGSPHGVRRELASIQSISSVIFAGKSDCVDIPMFMLWAYIW
ncbi:hypothetical protein PSV08DRAFT_303700, partial [Bipolaris maydis]|uniref:uncharacterized protein n=1 Tax=Cochliobolus heterostrophus TaxID=5016 RepID=UPI0024DC0B37